MTDKINSIVYFLKKTQRKSGWSSKTLLASIVGLWTIIYIWYKCQVGHAWLRKCNLQSGTLLKYQIYCNIEIISYPWKFPFIWHRNDIIIHHMPPVLVNIPLTYWRNNNLIAIISTSWIFMSFNCVFIGRVWSRVYKSQWIFMSYTGFWQLIIYLQITCNYHPTIITVIVACTMASLTIAF